MQIQSLKQDLVTDTKVTRSIRMTLLYKLLIMLVLLIGVGTLLIRNILLILAINCCLWMIGNCVKKNRVYSLREKIIVLQLIILPILMKVLHPKTSNKLFSFRFNSLSQPKQSESSRTTPLTTNFNLFLASHHLALNPMKKVPPTSIT